MSDIHITIKGGINIIVLNEQVRTDRCQKEELLPEVEIYSINRE